MGLVCQTRDGIPRGMKEGIEMSMTALLFMPVPAMLAVAVAVVIVLRNRTVPGKKGVL